MKIGILFYFHEYKSSSHCVVPAVSLRAELGHINTVCSSDTDFCTGGMLNGDVMIPLVVIKYFYIFIMLHLLVG